MFEALLKVLGSGLSLWESSEKRKYVDRLMALKKDYYEEFSKDPAIRSDATLDNIIRELCILGDAFSTSVGAENASPKP